MFLKHAKEVECSLKFHCVGEGDRVRFDHHNYFGWAVCEMVEARLVIFVICDIVVNNCRIAPSTMRTKGQFGVFSYNMSNLTFIDEGNTLLAFLCKDEKESK